MLLNRVEKALMNNPVRAAVQRSLEAGRLLRLGGALDGGVALEVGCGRGVGVEIIRDRFGAAEVHAFDLDPDMVARARARCGDRVRLWTGSATAIDAEPDTYDAVFDSVHGRAFRTEESEPASAVLGARARTESKSQPERSGGRSERIERSNRTSASCTTSRTGARPFERCIGC